ncbi:MAG: amidohydrolase [Acidobacteria bacterium]|nr:amidohydrolase [Acidobacteriota bacterium]MCI0719033.1 amidohydrolase [Acidobacteriota bacterium]
MAANYTISRRAFLAGLAAGPLAAPRSVVIDTHMHVWTNETERFPFAHPFEANFKPPHVAGTVEMFVEEMDRHAIDHAVLVQVIYYGWDNRYVAHCLKRQPQRFRGHGLIDPTDPEVASKLEYWMREHGLSGMRFSPIYYAGRDEWLTSKPHRRLWKKAEALRAIFNFFIAANQLAKLEKMLADYPAVNVVIDHLARVDLTSSDPAGEVAQLTRLARYPNVWVKVSELSILSPSKKYPYADTFPSLRRVYDAFGPDRLLWGTGFPGATRTQAGRPSLEHELTLIRREIPFFSPQEREKVMGQNAARLWRFAP